MLRDYYSAREIIPPNDYSGPIDHSSARENEDKINIEDLTRIFGPGTEEVYVRVKTELEEGASVQRFISTLARVKTIRFLKHRP